MGKHRKERENERRRKRPFRDRGVHLIDVLNQDSIEALSESLNGQFRALTLEEKTKLLERRGFISGEVLEDLRQALRESLARSFEGMSPEEKIRLLETPVFERRLRINAFYREQEKFFSELPMEQKLEIFYRDVAVERFGHRCVRTLRHIYRGRTPKGTYFLIERAKKYAENLLRSHPAISVLDAETLALAKSVREHKAFLGEAAMTFEQAEQRLEAFPLDPEGPVSLAEAA